MSILHPLVPNTRFPQVGAPSDKGCVDCGKIANQKEDDYYVIDSLGRYWCVAHAAFALGGIGRRNGGRLRFRDYMY